MVKRLIELDEDSDQLLTELAREYGGDAGRALSELLRSREGIEEFMQACETAHSDALLVQKDRSEHGARESFTDWEEIKRRHNL